MLVYVLLILSLVAWSGEVLWPDRSLAQYAELGHDPEDIRSFSEQLQIRLSHEKDEKIIISPSFKKLVEVQTRMVNFLRVSSSLNSTNCRVDPLTKSVKAQVLLEATLAASNCSTYSSDLILKHSSLATLTDEINQIETHSYKGVYTVDDKGKMTFPWEWKTPPKTPLKNTLPSLDESPDDVSFKDSLFRGSLKNAFSTYLNLELGYNENARSKLDVEKFVADFCHYKKTYFSVWTKEQHSIKCSDSLKKLFVRQTEDAFKTTRVQNYESAANEINAKMVRVNEIALKLQKNSLAGLKTKGEAVAQYQKNHPGAVARVGAPDARGTAKFANEAEAQRDYMEYRYLHSELIKSGPGLMGLTSELRSKMGLKAYDPYDFVNLHPKIDDKEFKAAVTEAREHVREHSSELLSIYYSKKTNEDKIASFLDLNPSAAGKILLSEPKFAFLACAGLKKLDSEALDDQQKREVIKWGGIIVGGAISATGVGMIPMSIVGAVTGAPDIVFQTQDLLHADKVISSSYSEKNAPRIIEAQKKYDVAKRNLILAVALETVRVGDDFRLGKFAKKELKYVKRLQANRKLAAPPPKYDAKLNLTKTYAGEEEGLSEKGKDFVVKYLSPKERLKNEVFVYDGKLIDAKGKLLSSDKEYIFVMDQEGRMFMSNKQVAGSFHHSSLVAGESVASAGEVIIKKGLIIKMNNRSAHYFPVVKDMQLGISRFQEMGLDLSETKFKIYRPTP